MTSQTWHASLPMQHIMLHSLLGLAVLQAQQASLDMLSSQHVRLCNCTPASTSLQSTWQCLVAICPKRSKTSMVLQQQHAVMYRAAIIVMQQQLKCIRAACLLQPLTMPQMKQTLDPQDQSSKQSSYCDHHSVHSRECIAQVCLNRIA